jgi:hypothetical protein
VEQTDPRRRTSARLAFADHVDYLVAGQRAPSAPEGAEMLTGVYPPLDDATSMTIGTLIRARLTPALGWSSWSFIRNQPNEIKIEAQALALHQKLQIPPFIWKLAW